MAGVSYLPWMLGVLEDCPGEGYWLSFTNRLPISYKHGDCLFGILNLGWLVHDDEDAEGGAQGRCHRGRCPIGSPFSLPYLITIQSVHHGHERVVRESLGN